MGRIFSFYSVPPAADPPGSENKSSFTFYYLQFDHETGRSGLQEVSAHQWEALLVSLGESQCCRWCHRLETQHSSGWFWFWTILRNAQDGSDGSFPALQAFWFRISQGSGWFYCRSGSAPTWFWLELKVLNGFVGWLCCTDSGFRADHIYKPDLLSPILAGFCF